MREGEALVRSLEGQVTGFTFAGHSLGGTGRRIEWRRSEAEPERESERSEQSLPIPKLALANFSCVLFVRKVSGEQRGCVQWRRCPD